MLIFNARRIFSLRGIEKPFSFLHKNGLIRSTASSLVSGNVSHIKIEYIGRICELLNCTPNDLFEWKPDADSKLPEKHALNSLQKGETMKNFRELVKDIPVEKLDRIEALLEELKNGNA